MEKSLKSNLAFLLCSLTFCINFKWFAYGAETKCVTGRHMDGQTWVKLNASDSEWLGDKYILHIVDKSVCTLPIFPIYQTFWNSSDQAGRESQGPAIQSMPVRVSDNFFALQPKSEMQLVYRNDHGQLGSIFCFKWHLLLKHATVSMVINHCIFIA